MSYHKKKKFQCPYCKKSFRKARQLKSHIKDKHPSENLAPRGGCGFVQCTTGFGCEYCVVYTSGFPS